MKKLIEIQPGETCIVDCIDINDVPYHQRITALGLMCLDEVTCSRKSHGMIQLSTGQGKTTHFALRQKQCEGIWIR